MIQKVNRVSILAGKACMVGLISSQSRLANMIAHRLSGRWNRFCGNGVGPAVGEEISRSNARSVGGPVNGVILL